MTTSDKIYSIFSISILLLGAVIVASLEGYIDERSCRKPTRLQRNNPLHKLGCYLGEKKMTKLLFLTLVLFSFINPANALIFFSCGEELDTAYDKKEMFKSLNKGCDEISEQEYDLIKENQQQKSMDEAYEEFNANTEEKVEENE